MPWLGDRVLEIDDRGVVVGSRPARSEDPPQTWPGALLVPGFVDVHVHYPQTRVLGSASGPLLPWLQHTVFPEEARFADAAYAREVADTFTSALIHAGTTTAAIYGSPHASASDVLLQTLATRGLRADAGPALMDIGAPAANLVPADRALADLEALFERWHGHDGDRLRVSVVPRFALSCTPALMRRAGEVAQRRGALLQTHVSENLDEVAAVRAVFPEARDYLDVYERHGVASERTILAHCIHFTDEEWDRMAARDVAVAHCPDSNFFLGSGCMPLARALRLGLRVGLGSDVGAGRSFSLRRVAAAAYDASLVVGARVEPQTLLWLATRGGALALGRDEVGSLAAGRAADVAVIDVAPDLLAELPDRVDHDPASGDHSPSIEPALARLLDALLFRHDAPPVRATVVAGRTIA
jgi:guanine deaminase